MTVNEALDLLMDDSESYNSADIFITPPEVSEDTDVDSADEDNDGTRISYNNLSGNQLSADCSVTLNKQFGKETINSIDSDTESESSSSNNSDEEIYLKNKAKKRRKVYEKPERIWRHCEHDTSKFMSYSFETDENEISMLDLTPTLLFEKYFDEDVCNWIVQMTNLYAQQRGKENFNMTVSDLKLCLAIFLISGYNPLPRKRMYWEHAEDVRNEAIATAFPYKRFEEILRYLHLADNSRLDKNDKMSKLRPFISKLNERFLKFWPESQNINVDESMIPYYGRHSAKQFIQNKPIRYGYKVWCLNTPSGYLIQFEPYQGAGTVPILAELGMGGSVVVDLIKNLPQKRFNIFFDNLFTSIPLLERLSSMGMNATGTLRQNRIQKCPITTVNSMKKMDRGSFDYRLDKSSDVLICRWNDNNVVTVASTIHGVTPTGTVKRWSRKDHREIQIPIPNMIMFYNQNMGGTDRMDENIGYYRSSIRINKWWWPLFMAMVSFAVHNAWQLYRLSSAASHRPLDQLGFIRDVSTTLILGNRKLCTSKSLGRFPALDKRIPTDIRFDGINHHLISGPTQRRCRQCGKKTIKRCVKCPDCPLHQDCSIAFHTKN